MTQYIVYAIEKHPDRIIDDSYGPFDTYEEANQFANAMHDHDSNRVIHDNGMFYGSRYNDFRILLLTAPQNA